MNRRSFLSMIGAAGSIFFMTACSTKKKEMSKEDAKKLQQAAANYHKKVKFISEGDPVAKTFKYVIEPDKGLTSLRKDKMGIAGNKQYCDNCQFYVPKDGNNYGECQLLAGRGMVKDKAWCASWVPKKSMS